jgi:biopolymer transport protein ExbD
MSRVETVSSELKRGGGRSRHGSRSASGRRRLTLLESELDITPMIDVTFLLLIFFLVTSIRDRQTDVELPPARNGSAVDPQRAIVFTVSGRGDRGDRGEVFAGESTSNDARLSSDEAEFRAQVVDLIEQGRLGGRRDVLIKAERHLPHREVAKVIRAASQFGDIQIHLAVLEVD